MPGPPSVLWPAPGDPRVLDPGDRALSLLVAGGSADGSLAAFGARLRLQPVAEGPPVGLAVEGVEDAPPAFAREVAADAVALPGVAAAGLRRVRLRVAGDPSPRPPARVATYDLASPEGVVRSRAVAARGADDGRVALAFASDLHLAELFRALGDAVRRFAPDLATRYLDPELHLARLVEACNAAVARGALDVVILGGDLVDHVYRSPRADGPRGAEDSNVPDLVAALAGLHAPTFVIPGNHDYRLYPWRPRTYGLGELGLPHARTSALLRAAGMWDPWPFRLSDLDALRSREPDGRSALAQHLLFLAPRCDRSVRFGSLSLVFASTGRDVLPRWRALERGRLSLLVRALPSTWEHPDLEGLAGEQVLDIARAFEVAHAEGRGAALFLHAPLLHPPERGPIEARVPRLAPPAADDLASRVAFERSLRRSGLRRGVLFRNAAPLVHALRRAPTPVAFFAGHVHRGHAATLARADGTLRSTPLAGTFSDAERVALVTAPSLGQTDVRGEETPGYLTAHFEHGALAGVTRHSVTGPDAG